MDTDRPHRSSSGSSTSELFICFTSRLSSSSMKISSKSILSPGRARESSQISLSNSFSRRLRSNGSMKGGQASPMFPTNGKKRGCAFENPEPSSPKVTCIGQVRVKTKKQGKKLRTRSQRRGGGEVSFRRVEQSNGSDGHQDLNNQFLNQQEGLPHRNQKWVHLPVTICGALRSFGAEFNCFLPCRSSCMASEKEKEEKAAGSSNGSSCGAVLARWLVAVQEGDGKGREIELVVGEDEEEGEDGAERRSYRRHVFEEIEFNDEKFEGGNECVQEEEGRVSICIPPKNALLLMRCRSDPVKMAALANKFWEAPVPNEKEDDDGNKQQETDNVGIEDEQSRDDQAIKHKEEDLMNVKCISCETIEELEIQENDFVSDSQGRSTAIGDGSVDEVNLVLNEEQTEAQVNEQQERTIFEEIEDAENLIKNQENEENEELLQESEDSNENSLIAQKEEDIVLEGDNFINEVDESSLQAKKEFEEADDEKEDQESKQTQALLEELTIQDSEEAAAAAAEAEETATHERSELEDPETREDKMDIKSKERESQPSLPDCLLLMMCEPKLSMEVSKETWVCSTDFIKWLPDHSRPVKKKNGGDQPKKRPSIDINPPLVHSSNLQQPHRSSCSYPAKPPPLAAGAESMSTAIEKKLIGTEAYEPFALKRCKSEPMRTASKLVPGACFWKNRKLEPHRSAALGVGAAGVGF